MEVVGRMVSARNECTANHPPGSAGWMAWSHGTCRLREVFLPQGWDKNEEHHVSSVCNGSGMRIAVSNTDDGTGLEDRQPQNRSKKGAGTDRIVANNENPFSGLLAEALNVVQLSPVPGGITYWYLCVYAEGDVLRAELSCPSDCAGGFFTAFYERIILVGKDGGGTTAERRKTTGGGESDFEINVTRKQAS